MNAQEYVNELSRYTFSDPRIQVHSDCMMAHNAVRISISCIYFASVDPDVGPQDGKPVSIFRQDVIDMGTGAPPPEVALRKLWRVMWNHEFDEQLRLDQEPVHDPHGRKKLVPSVHPHPRSDDEIYRRGERGGLRRLETGSLLRELEERCPDPGTPDGAPSKSK